MKMSEKDKALRRYKVNLTKAVRELDKINWLREEIKDRKMWLEEYRASYRYAFLEWSIALSLEDGMVWGP